MGEAKRRRDTPFNPQNRMPSVAAAWESYQRLLGPGTEREQLAFWAGASVLFYALLNTLDDGEEPTDADLAKTATKRVKSFHTHHHIKAPPQAAATIHPQNR